MSLEKTVAIIPVIDEGWESVPAFGGFHVSWKQGSMKRFTNLPSIRVGAGPVTPGVLDSNLSCMVAAVLNMSYLTSMQLKTVTTSVIRNTNSVIPDDKVGQEGMKKLLIRITNASDPTENRVIKFYVPGFTAGGSGTLLTEAQVETELDVIKSKLAYTYSADGTDIVEILG